MRKALQFHVLQQFEHQCSNAAKWFNKQALAGRSGNCNTLQFQPFILPELMLISTVGGCG